MQAMEERYRRGKYKRRNLGSRISGLVAEYIVAIDVTRVRFPADAKACWPRVQMRHGLVRLREICAP